MGEQKGSCFSGSATTTSTAAETKTVLLLVGQTRRFIFIFDHNPYIVTILQTAI